MSVSPPPLSAALPALPPRPLVGRARELEQLRELLERVEARREPAAVLLVGESGVGKTRLLQALAEWAKSSGWAVSIGTAYPMERGVPYAALTDALDPLVRDLDAATLSGMVRGAMQELSSVLPRFGTERPPHVSDGGEELQPRVMWSVTRLLERIASRRPLLLAIDNLQWSDHATLELLHFAVRQAHGVPLVLIGTISDVTLLEDERLAAIAESLRALAHVTTVPVAPLGLTDIEELIEQTFGAPKAATRDFTTLLFGWTRGNVYFIEETLKTLVADQRLGLRNGRWEGWDIERLALPGSIRDALLRRVVRLPPNARMVADRLALLGARVAHHVLATVCGLPDDALFSALDDLRRQRLVHEFDSNGDVSYDFMHPMIRETLVGDLGRARARALHSAIPEALERAYGAQVDQHTHELAYHYLHAARPDEPRLREKAARCLAMAGMHALASSANRDAATYLGAALERLAGAPAEQRMPIVEALAQARQRLGEYESARTLLLSATEWAHEHAPDRVAEFQRRLALTAQWGGHHDDAFMHYDAALAAAEATADRGMQARVLLARGMCRQELGDPQTARADVSAARELAEQLGDHALLARLHRTLLLLGLWTGSPREARFHGEVALDLARETGQTSVECTVQWALAMLAGLTGNGEATRYHTAQAEQLAEQTNSPVLRLWVAEIAIELASATGEWETAIALGDRAISLARALGQRTLLPRLLVWTAFMRLARGELEAGGKLIDEAWEVSGAAAAERGRSDIDVHSVVPAHAGRAYQLVVARQYDDAIRVAEAGLAIADRCGYPAWAVYRLLPVLCEACLRARDVERAARYGERLSRESERLGNPLGRAWAIACEALLPLARGESERGIELLRTAIAAIEGVPFTYDAARMRKELASLLASAGRREEAVRELRLAHDVLARLGAAPDLQQARDDLRRLGARPPARSAAAGVEGLTAREIEIIRLVCLRRSNKEIATALNISPRTVSTHLSNIFEKMEIASRGELADVARQAGLT
jgi:DNA-binding CsgD family transcriptional regulator